MRIILVWAICAVCIEPFGYAEKASEQKQNPVKLDKQAAQLLEQGKFLAAANSFQSQFDRTEDLRAKIRLCNSWASSLFYALQYSLALRRYLECQRLNESFRDPELSAVLASNLSSLFLAQGDTNAAMQCLGNSLAVVPRASPYRPLIMLQRAEIARSREEFMMAETLIQDAFRILDENVPLKFEEKSTTLNASLSVFWASSARAYESLGLIRLTQADLVGAEDAITQSFKIRKIQRVGSLAVAYHNLALLRERQSRLTEALTLQNRALQEATQHPTAVPLWVYRLERGQIRVEMGDLTGALNDYQSAWSAAVDWRTDVMPAHWIQSASDFQLSKISERLCDVLMLLGKKRGNVSLMSRAFLVHESTKAVELWRGSRANMKLAEDPEYTQNVLALRRELSRNTGLANDEVCRLRGLLTVEEAKHGTNRMYLPKWNDTENALELLRKSIPQGQALISIHVGVHHSWRWTLTRQDFSATEIAATTPFVLPDMARSEPPGVPAHDVLNSIHNTVLRGLPASVRRAKFWWMSLEKDLFAIPWALIPGVNGGEYLLNERAFAAVESACSLSRPAPDVTWPKTQASLVSISDPIYNTADSRTPVSITEMHRSNAEGKALRGEGSQLARLVGSTREIRLITSAWGPHVNLSGSRANVDNLRSILNAKPSIVHFATHVLPVHPRGQNVMHDKESITATPSRPEDSSIALSIGQDGRPEQLTIEEIHSLPVNESMIVMSACESMAGSSLPGAGLFGLSRAWLVAGARSAIGSLWPIPDDTGEFFAFFYGALRKLKGDSRSAPARAMQQAQMLYLRQHPNGDARLWGGFYVLTR